MWTSAEVVALLAELGIRPGGTVDVELLDVGEAGNAVPDMPDRLALVYPTPGTGESLDGIADTRGFQLRIRWNQNDPLGAEYAALTADRLIRKAQFPRVVGDVWVVYAGRAGGAPTQLPDAVNDGDRTTYVCTYLATVIEPDDEET